MSGMNRLLAACLAVGLTAAAFVPLAALGNSTYQEILARPQPKADAHIAYGKDPLQFGDLYLPTNAAEHPVVVLIHGGCWQADIPGVPLMSQMVEPLRARGFAVWNIEYRRLGNAGGGYPGTFEDTAKAIDALRDIAKTHRLDLAHIVLVGHSAGGHLALWAAGRSRIPPSSALHGGNPLPIHGVVSLSGIDDLQSYRASGGQACGGESTIDELVGKHDNPYADTSPSELVPLGVPQTIISGGLDRIVAARFGHDYAAKAKAAGDTVVDQEIPDAGHFEMIDPKGTAWPAILAAIEDRAK